jgi:ABC-type transport system involved in Fe-S cluster assembly fused permease/ATPase subunit
MRMLKINTSGCGKSTLALSLFRFVEPTEGQILIDGIDITNVGLTDLRQRVTIIPQVRVENLEEEKSSDISSDSRTPPFFPVP